MRTNAYSVDTTVFFNVLKAMSEKGMSGRDILTGWEGSLGNPADNVVAALCVAGKYVKKDTE